MSEHLREEVRIPYRTDDGIKDEEIENVAYGKLMPKIRKLLMDSQDSEVRIQTHGEWERDPRRLDRVYKVEAIVDVKTRTSAERHFAPKLAADFARLGVDKSPTASALGEAYAKEMYHRLIEPVGIMPADKIAAGTIKTDMLTAGKLIPPGGKTAKTLEAFSEPKVDKPVASPEPKPGPVDISEFEKELG